MEYDTVSADATARAIAALRQASDAVVGPESPRRGTAVYCFARPLATRGCESGERLHFTEVFADSAAWSEALPEPAVDAAVTLYTDLSVVGALLGGAVGVDADDDCSVAGVNTVCRARMEEVLSGSLLLPDALRACRPPPRAKGIVLEIRAEPLAGSKSKARPLCFVGSSPPRPWWRQRRSPPLHMKGAASCAPPYKIRDQEPSPEFTDDALTLHVVSASSEGLADLLSGSLRAAAEASAKWRVLLAAEDWDDAGVSALCAVLGGEQIERLEVCAGYVLHPAYTSCSPPQPPQLPGKRPKQPAPQPAKEGAPFEIRRHPVTGAAEAYSFSTLAQPGAKRGGCVPLLAVVRSVCNVSPRDSEVAAGMLFGQLARLRALQSDAATLAGSLESDVAADDVLADRLSRFLDTLSGLGYPLAERAAVEFRGLDQLIESLEAEYAAVVEGGRAAAAAWAGVQSRGAGGLVGNSSPVEYMALQEVYPLGRLVVSRGVGMLSGALVGLRVADAHYEPTRSLFGARKFSFRLRLETLVALGGGGYLSVSWEEAFEEWAGTRDVSSLRFVPVPGAPDAELLLRAQSLSLLGADAAHFHHRAGCFFPHGRPGSSAGLGGASSAHRRAAPGSVVLDPRRGLELGHAPAFAVDEAGMAIASAFRAYRTVQQSATEGESDRARQERLRAAGLRVFSWPQPRRVPDEMAAVCWPAVACFSLTTKTWGHVLVDGIEPVRQSRVPWDALVLPAETKEVLLATAASALLGGAIGAAAPRSELPEELSAPARYTYRDVIDSKGTGMLFLLLGPPGTGKTLSVEALAAYFGRPLYAISFAELGKSVAELEERLTDVLSLASHWGALVLLDEGDALIEHRKPGELQINSMTGVLLRLLESFEGALFITSNRAHNIDPAAISRVTLAIRYERLTSTSVRSVWRSTLVRVLGDEVVGPQQQRRGSVEAEALVDSKYDLDKLSDFGGSGQPDPRRIEQLQSEVTRLHALLRESEAAKALAQAQVRAAEARVAEAEARALAEVKATVDKATNT
eukprot:m51a1_g5294 hypothetical protein (1028) ;mRNA; f:214142-218324